MGRVFCARLCFVGNYAVVGTSKPRYGGLYSGLDLDDNLKERELEPRCGFFIVDLRSGKIVHWLFIEGQALEIYEVTALPGVRRPMALGLITDEIQTNIWFDPPEQSRE